MRHFGKTLNSQIHSAEHTLCMATSHSKGMAKWKTSRAGRVAWWLWPIAGTVVLFFLFLAILIFGRVSGVELSKQDLVVRNFSYFQIPVLRWQVWPVERAFPNGAATDLAISSHLKPLGPGQQVQWDLVQFEEFGSATVQGDAAILYQILQQRNESSDFFWAKWSATHPRRSAELWPAVQDLVFCDMYWAIPPLMELYFSGTSDSSLIPERNESVVQSASVELEEARARQDQPAISKILDRLQAYDSSGELSKIAAKFSSSSGNKEVQATAESDKKNSAEE